MRHLILVLAFFVFGCNNPKEVIEVCGAFQDEAIVQVEMVATEDTDNEFYTFWGSAIDINTGEKAPFVKIKLISQDTVFKGALTDLDGSFSIDLEPGVYSLEVSYVGFESYTSELTALPGMKEGIEISLDY